MGGLIPRSWYGSVSATAFAGLLVQVGRPLVSLVTLPLLLGHLGQAGLGVWMIALSLMGLVGFVSAGLSSSVVTAIGRASAEDSMVLLPQVVSTATLIAALWGGVVLVFLVPVALLANWSGLLQLTDPVEAEEVRQLMIALSLLLAFGLVAVVPRQIMVGRMHGYLAYFLDFIGVVAGAVMLVVALQFDVPLWLLGIAFTAPSFLTMLVGGLVYLHSASLTLFSPRLVNGPIMRQLGGDSLRMAGYQSAYAVSSQSDLILIGVILGAPASAAYGVAQRVFSLPILVAATVNYAQWPAMARADAKGDHGTLARMFRLTLLIGSGLAVLVAVGAAVAYQPLLGLWLGHPLPTEPAILFGMVAWVAVATLVNTCDSVLRARNEMGFLMRAMIAMAVINIAVTLLLLPQIGPAGAIWGSVTGFTLALLLPYGLRLRTILVAPKQERADAE